MRPKTYNKHFSVGLNIRYMNLAGAGLGVFWDWDFIILLQLENGINGNAEAMQCYL